MRLYRFLFVAVGIICVGIGMIGVVLPVLPTTPFLILASVCFVKGSDKFNIWFKKTKLYKNYAEDFVNHRAMTIKRKTQIMALSDFMLLFPLIRLDSFYMKGFIIVVALLKYWYFTFRIKTI